MALWIDNSEMVAVVKVVFIYNECIWGNSTDELQTGEKYKEVRVIKDKEG